MYASEGGYKVTYTCFQCRPNPASFYQRLVGS